MQLEDLSNNKVRKVSKKTRGRKKIERSVATKSPVWYKVALILCTMGFIATTGSLIWYGIQANKASAVFAEYQPVETEELSVESLPTVLTYVDVRGVYVWDRYVNAYLKNSDCIGWIHIPGTEIDYPVAQSVDTPDYYLHRDLNKEYSFAGTIFADSGANLQTLSNNVVLYGHHMRNGSMFASLENYDSEEYFNQHKTIVFDTINGRQTYEVISAFRISANNEFKYASFLESKDEEEMQQWIDEVLERSYIKGTTASRSDKFLTLSTCDYTLSDGRFVVVAKMVSNSDMAVKKYITLNEYQSGKESEK